MRVGSPGHSLGLSKSYSSRNDDANMYAESIKRPSTKARLQRIVVEEKFLVAQHLYANNQPMIELKNISKSYGGHTILAQMDLAIAPGRTTVLIGPSGCGKSTLLRLMIGLARPDTGTVLIEGQVLNDDNVLTVRRGLGYVIQDGGLFPHLTARDNVSLMARYLGWDRERIDKRLAELTELTQFPTNGLDRYPGQLSGGQRQRVSLMRALILDPKVILLDEPLGALDPMVRAELQADLRKIFRSLEKTVVMVTHDMAEAGWFGHEILLLRDGQIIQRGTLSALINAPADPFVTRFVGAQRQLLEIGAEDGL
jgi:osmoprotectant transport system ATP-binding protein